jgi:hypothetical protein
MQITIFEQILQIFETSPILNIYGKSGTGKSSLVQYIIGKILRKEPRFYGIWFKASESFSTIRLKSLFPDNPQILDKFYLLPRNHPCETLAEQSNYLSRIATGDLTLPPFINYLIIDNISHHLRRESAELPIRQHMFMKNKFFESSLLPFIFFCQRQDINLILIHEATQIPSNKEKINGLLNAEEIIRPYFHKLFEKIISTTLYLEKINQFSFRAEIRKDCASSPPEYMFHYKILDSRFLFYE